jgi:hypothetical protein
MWESLYLDGYGLWLTSGEAIGHTPCGTRLSRPHHPDSPIVSAIEGCNAICDGWAMCHVRFCTTSSRNWQGHLRVWEREVWGLWECTGCQQHVSLLELFPAVCTRAHREMLCVFPDPRLLRKRVIKPTEGISVKKRSLRCGDSISRQTLKVSHHSL